jgi:hypothetical protein
MKICTKCKKSFPETNFYGNKKAKDRLHAWCKGCFLETTAERYRSPKGRYTTMKKDAKKNNIGFDISLEYVESIWSAPCTYCGEPIEGMSLDRIDSRERYTEKNVAQCCKWCNFTKGTGSTSYFYKKCKMVVDNMPIKMKKLGSTKDSGLRYLGQVGNYERPVIK